MSHSTYVLNNHLWKLDGRPEVLLFILLLLAQPVQAVKITRGPYLQMPGMDTITIRWQTDTPAGAVVSYGNSPESLNEKKNIPRAMKDHQVILSGLRPGTQYYYSVSTGNETLAGGDKSYRFQTAPAPEEVSEINIWVTGDSGTGTTGPKGAGGVYRAYMKQPKAENTHLWLMLGDNAYPMGLEENYQRTLFNMYPELLRRTPVFTTPGNHEIFSANSQKQSGPYYRIFSLPKDGQLGGFHSGTEAYYSFDYGNIHFISLNSEDVDRSPGGAMMLWLREDISNTRQQWIIAFWHRPPYTKGCYNSDSQWETEMQEMRENFLPVLESHGVDLVLSGHDHNYQRSFLLNGQYGSSGKTSVQYHLVPNSESSDNQTYRKAKGANQPGTIYSVVGASGKTCGGSLNHPNMIVSSSRMGSLSLTVTGDCLNAKYILTSGETGDNYRLCKGVGTEEAEVDKVEAFPGRLAIDDVASLKEEVSSGQK